MNFNSLIPELSVSDLARSLKFYRDILGFQIEYERPEDKFLFLSFENIQLMIEQHNGNWETGQLSYPFGRGINFQVEVSNIQPILERINKAELKLFKEPEDVLYRAGNQQVTQRQFLIMDPDGYLLRFCQRL